MKPILFNTEAVRGILEERKTMTRRVLKPHNYPKAKRLEYRQGAGLWFDNEINAFDKDTHIKDYSISSPWIGTQIYIQKYAPYRPGDILYVRETFFEHRNHFYYKADGKHEGLSMLGIIFKWRPSIHMPRKAARIFLRVTDVRVERLQEITEVDAEKEGLRYYDDICRDENWHPMFYDPDSGGDPSTVAGFAKLWSSTIKPTDLALYGWEANPWVWVIEFERINKEVCS